MSQPIYTLSIDGAAQIAPESIGAQLLKRERHSLKTDSLTIGFVRLLNGALPLAYNSRVKVYSDGLPFFEGRVAQPGHDQAANNGRYSVTLLGPWDFLERWPALRDFNAGFGGAYGVPAWVAGSTSTSDNWAWGIQNGTGLMATGYQALYSLAAVEYAQTSDPWFTVADIPAGETPPDSQNVTGQKVADIVRLCSRWTPQIAWWFDYDTTPPTLRAMPMEPMTLSGAVSLYWVGIDRTGVTGPGSAPPRWEFTNYVHSEEETAVAIALGQDATSFSGRVRWDMVPSALRIRTSSGSRTHPIGAETHAPDVTWLARAGGSVPAALAEYLYNSLATPRLEGTLVLPGGRPSIIARPGRVWDITGDDEATSRGIAKAWTQSVSDDLLTGATTCTLGFPGNLGAGQMLSLSRWAKLMTSY